MHLKDGQTGEMEVSAVRFLIAGKQQQAMQDMERALSRMRGTVERETDGAKALDKCMEDTFDCLVLDADSLWVDAVQVICGIRDAGIETPILLLVEKGHRRLGVAALNAGADDFLMKPFALDEFAARARALARRCAERAPNCLLWGDLSLNVQTFDLQVGTEVAHLSSREYQIMELLICERGRLISAEEITGRIWGTDSGVSRNVVWVHIAALRKKMRAMHSAMRIGTYRGQGYALEKDG